MYSKMLHFFMFTRISNVDVKPDLSLLSLKNHRSRPNISIYFRGLDYTRSVKLALILLQQKTVKLAAIFLQQKTVKLAATVKSGKVGSNFSAAYLRSS